MPFALSWGKYFLEVLGKYCLVQFDGRSNPLKKRTVFGKSVAEKMAPYLQVISRRQESVFVRTFEAGIAK